MGTPGGTCGICTILVLYILKHVSSPNPPNHAQNLGRKVQAVPGCNTYITARSTDCTAPGTQINLGPAPVGAATQWGLDCDTPQTCNLTSRLYLPVGACSGWTAWHAWRDARPLLPGRTVMHNCFPWAAGGGERVGLDASSACGMPAHAGGARPLQ